jgi:hypothetical protein
MTLVAEVEVNHRTGGIVQTISRINRPEMPLLGVSLASRLAWIIK